MRKILIFLIVASLIMGLAGAVPRWGPPQGFYTKYLDADMITADVITSGVNISEDGSIGTDVTLGADKFLKAASGSGYVDFSAATGVFKTSTGAVTVGPGAVTVSGATTFNKGVYYKCNATTTISTTLTASDVATVYPVDASGGDVTLTLPDPTTVAGRMYVISTVVDMGSHNIIVATTGSGKFGGVGGADTLTSTDILAALTVISDGTHYVTIGKVGTWT